MSLLRRIWETLMDHQVGPAEERRARSPLAEPAGLCPASGLRPGRGRLAGVGNVADRAGQAGARRRPASAPSRGFCGGGSRADCRSGQQRAIADPLLAAVRSLHRRTTAGKGSTRRGLHAAAVDRDVAAAGRAGIAAGGRQDGVGRQAGRLDVQEIHAAGAGGHGLGAGPHAALASRCTGR